MWRMLILGTLFAALITNPSWAQNKKDLNPPGVTYPGGSAITYQWNYSCPADEECSFTCGTDGASHVSRLGIYVGGTPISGDQKNVTLSYKFTTREHRRGSGFNINTGISTLQCQVNGLTLDYSGAAREGGRTIDPTGTVSQNNK